MTNPSAKRQAADKPTLADIFDVLLSLVVCAATVFFSLLAWAGVL